MKRLCLLDTSYPINTRNIRLLESLKENYKIDYITWNRDESEIINDGFKAKVYVKKSKYGNKFLKAIKLIGFFNFIKSNIKSDRPDIVIASHWDMLFICYLLKFKYNFKLVYDNLDMPDSKSKILRILITLLERLCTKKVDGIILASRFFKKFYTNTNYLIYENYTFMNNTHLSVPKNSVPKNIAFLGNVRHFELLKNLALAFKNNKNYNIHIYGSGIVKDKLEKYCFSNQINNINFYGKYNYNDIETIYTKIDYVWAAYPNQSFNVKYAISNKFFEVISQNKIGIYSNNTELGDFVKFNKIGIVVDPYSIESIRKEIFSLEKNDAIQQILTNLTGFKSKENVLWKEHEFKLLNFFNKIEG